MTLCDMSKSVGKCQWCTREDNETRAKPGTMLNCRIQLFFCVLSNFEVYFEFSPIFFSKEAWMLLPEFWKASSRSLKASIRSLERFSQKLGRPLLKAWMPTTRSLEDFSKKLGRLLTEAQKTSYRRKDSPKKLGRDLPRSIEGSYQKFGRLLP